MNDESLEGLNTDDLQAELKRRKKGPWKRVKQAGIGVLATALTAAGGYLGERFLKKADEQERIAISHQAQMQAVWRAIGKLRDETVNSKLSTANNTKDIEWMIRLDAAPEARPERVVVEDAAMVIELPIDEPPVMAETSSSPVMLVSDAPPPPAPRRPPAKAYKPSQRDLDQAQQTIQELLEK